MFSIKKALFTIVIFIIAQSIQASVRLPALISDGMILQRDADVKIWGWAEKNEKIQVQFMDKVYRTTSSNSGKWEVHFSNLKPGGPFKMVIQGSEIIIIDDILVGDVWVCSGQSNMNYKVNGAKSIYGEEIANSLNSNIRQFDVPEVPNFHAPQDDLKRGKWISANPETVLNFSAVAYFFASELYQKYKVPIGLIHSSLSGSPAQAWISMESIKEFPQYLEEAIKHQDDEYVSNIMNKETNRREEWFKKSKDNDEGYKSAGSWFHPATDVSEWRVMSMPGSFSDGFSENTNGIYWLRKDIDIHDNMVGKAGKLGLGRIVNADSVYINGFFVGATGHQWARRNYDIPEGLLKAGKNTIVIRIINHNGNGGFIKGYPFQLSTDNHTVDIAGEWKVVLGTKMANLPFSTVFNWKATGLFNGMIAPLTDYTIKGAIWYQGEGNAGKAKEYATLFPRLIRDWRKHWNQGDFSFIFVQLANFMQPTEHPSESNWAMLRESQRKTLSLSNTGMAVAIDIGEANDVHPMNKKEVGVRLALEAQRVAYEDNSVVSSGPLYRSMEIEESEVILSFDTFGSHLKVRGDGDLQYFAIAGSDKKFLWAKAEIINDKIRVWHPDIPNPVSVRYAWANNPETANLVNDDGLPASPFRTDDWDR